MTDAPPGPKVELVRLVRLSRAASGVVCLAALALAAFVLAHAGPGAVLGWLAVAIAVASLGFNRLYDRVLFAKVVPEDTPVPWDRSDLSGRDVIELADEFTNRLDWRVVDCLLDAAVEPASVRMRARERIQPRTRALERDVTLDLALDRSLTGMHFVPVARFRKGELQDFRQVVGTDGVAAPVLTYRQSTALYLAVLRWCVRGAGQVMTKSGACALPAREVYDKYAAEIEPALAVGLAARAPQGEPGAAEHTALDRAIRRLRKLGRRAEHPAMIGWAAALTDMLVDHYMIVARLPVESGTTAVRFQDLILPQPSRVAWRGEGGKRRTVPAVVLWVPYVLAGVADRLRLAVGSRAPRIEVSAQLARNSQSYHLEVVGPEGSFVSQQSIANFGRKELREQGVYDRWRGRHGQRFAHLYLRGASALDEPPAVRIGFMERPPGSIGLAALGALAALFLWGSWAAQPLTQEDARVGLAALFLAFPAGLAAWVGFTVHRSVYGVPFTTQVINVLTVLLSMLGCASALLDERELAREATIASGIVFAMALYWWYSRFTIHRDFLRRDVRRTTDE